MKRTTNSHAAKNATTAAGLYRRSCPLNPTADDAIVVVEPGHDRHRSRKEAAAMIAGLQIKIRGEELSRRMAERIREREDAIAALDRRIEQRAGDRRFTARAHEEHQTIAELEGERQGQRDVLLRITLVRNSLVEEELYLLDMSDLRVADLISSATPDAGQ